MVGFADRNVRKPAGEQETGGKVGRCAKFAAPWAGVVYRSASVAYANRDDLVTGAGAKHAGARWNPPNSVPSVYASLERWTATEEALAHHRYFGFPEETALPWVMVATRVNLQRVLNLADQKPRRSLGVNRGRLTGEDWRARNARGREALTQAIGRLAWEAGWEGLLVPSAADPGGVNLVVFPGNLVPPDSYLPIVNRDQLPPRTMPVN
jgi:RES domain-containing protein